MGRRKGTEDLESLSVWLPASLLRQVRLLLFDAAAGRVKYGAMNGLITELLNDWLEKQKKQHQSKQKELTDA